MSLKIFTTITFLASSMAAAGLLSLSGVPFSAAYNDIHSLGDPAGTHYVHCDDDGHHARRPHSFGQTMYYEAYFYGTVPTEYRNAFLSAREDWDATATKLSIGYYPWAINYWRTLNDPSGPSGLTIVECSSHPGGVHPIAWADAYINRAKSFNSLEKQAVASHEIGHQIGLSHSGFIEPIMFPIAPYRVATPQQDDVCGVNSMYRSSTYPVNVPPCHSDHYLP